MKKLLLLISLTICALVSQAQIHWYRIAGYNQYTGLKQDSVLEPPHDTLSSAPIWTLAIKNDHVYFKTAVGMWARVDSIGPGGGSGTGSADSLKRLFVDTGIVANNSYYLGFDSVNRKWKLYAVSFYDSTIMQTKYRSDTGRVNFYAALAAKLSAVATTNSVAGNGTPASPVQLAGDATSPGASKYYGTDGSGAKGWNSLPTGVAPANPTASIAYAPVNGTAPTYMRSDASPGLDTNALNIHTDGFNLGKYKRIADSSAASGYVTHTALNDSVQANADTTDYREIGATGVHSFYLTLNPHHIILAIPKMRGLLDASVATNGTDSVTEVSVQAHDSTSANRLATGYDVDSAKLNLRGAISLKLDSIRRKVASDSVFEYYNNGTKRFAFRDSTGGSGGGSTYVLDSVQTYTTGSTVTIGNGVSILVINPSTPISSLAVTLPATARACGYVKIVYGGTMTTGNTVVSNLTISANTGQTLIRNGTVGTVSAGDQAIVLNNISNTWYNEQ